jgi:hypothetical protein
MGARERMLVEGLDATRAALEVGYESTSQFTGEYNRDLSDLVLKGALTREGELRHARYRLNVPLGKVGQIKVDERGEVFEG